jgi:hypothetical protein
MIPRNKYQDHKSLGEIRFERNRYSIRWENIDTSDIDIVNGANCGSNDMTDSWLKYVIMRNEEVVLIKSSSVLNFHIIYNKTDTLTKLQFSSSDTKYKLSECTAVKIST